MLNRHRFRLGYGDCDPAGIIYFAAYLPRAELLHTEWWFQQGLPLDRHLDELGAGVVTRHLGADYTAAPRLHDEIVAELRLGGIGGSSFELISSFRSADGATTFATLELVMVYIGADGRPVEVPVRAREMLQAFSE